MSRSIPAASGASPPRAAAARQPIDDDRPLLETKNRGLVMAAVMAVSVCQFLDATIANVALPHMQAALGASSESISWVLTTFIIATAIATPITGWLSDRVGSRRLFLTSTLLFLLTSAACGAATSLPEMVLFRGLQGIAAAFIGPMTLTVMFDVSRPSKQVMMLAVFSMTVMVAPISGPFLGGFLTEYLNWRWIFYVNLPLGVPALIVLWWLLPSRPLERRPLDLLGFFAIGIALASLQLMLDRGQHNDWFQSWETVIELLVAISAFWVFVVHTRQTATPLFKREIFRNGNFLMSLAFMGLMGLAVVGLSAVLPMMFQSIYRYPVMDAGLMMAPRGIGVMLASLLAGMITRHVDGRLVMSIGYVIAAAGLFSMTRWSLEMDATPIVTAAFVQGFGLGFATTPLNQLAFSTLSPALRPDGSSLSSLFRSIGGSIGISAIVTILSRTQQVSHADLAGHITGDIVPGADLGAMVDTVPGIGSAAMMMIDSEVTRQATMISFIDMFFLLSCILLAFAPLPFLLKKAGPAGGTLPPPME